MQLRHRKWSVLVLTSILLLGNMGLSQEAFADKEKLENITFSYETNSSVTIHVTDKKGNLIVTVDPYNPDDTFTVDKSDFEKNKFDSKIFLTIFGTEITEEIHTSGSQLLVHLKQSLFLPALLMEL